jgi:hypothetical protein
MLARSLVVPQERAEVFPRLGIVIQVACGLSARGETSLAMCITTSAAALAGWCKVCRVDASGESDVSDVSDVCTHALNSPFPAVSSRPDV